jgi:hypothetical protein
MNGFKWKDDPESLSLKNLYLVRKNQGYLRFGDGLYTGEGAVVMDRRQSNGNGRAY